MTVIIKYKARMTWTDKDGFHEDELCNVVHEIDMQSLQTTKLDWEPVIAI